MQHLGKTNKHSPEQEEQESITQNWMLGVTRVVTGKERWASATLCHAPSRQTQAAAACVS